MKKLLFISLSLFIFYGCTPEQDSTFQPELTVFEGQDLDVFTQLNNYRANLGLNVLKGEKGLTEGCVNHCNYMISIGHSNHDGFYNRAMSANSVYFGEVIAYGFVSTEAYLSAYQSSPPHNATLINPNYTHIGIATIGNYQCINLAGYK